VHAPHGIDDRIAVVRGSHAAGAHGMEHARDVVANVLGKCRIVLDERGEIDAPIRQGREDRAGERRHDIDERGDERALDPVCRSDSVVTPLIARTFSCDRMSIARRKPCLKRARSSSWPRKLNSTQGRPASPAVSDTRPRAIGLSRVGAKLATWAPSALHEVLHCTLMYMSVAGAPGRPEE